MAQKPLTLEEAMNLKGGEIVYLCDTTQFDKDVINEFSKSEPLTVSIAIAMFNRDLRLIIEAGISFGLYAGDKRATLNRPLREYVSDVEINVQRRSIAPVGMRDNDEPDYAGIYELSYKNYSLTPADNKTEPEHTEKGDSK